MSQGVALQDSLASLVSDGFAYVGVPYHDHGKICEILARMVPFSIQVQTDEVIDSLATDPRYRRSMTGTYGHGEFPMHTDRAHDRIPPRFLLLSQQDASTAALTRVLPLRRLPLSPDDIPALKRDVWKVLFGRRPFLTPILNDTVLPPELILRWDPICMRSERPTESARILERCIALSEIDSFQLDPNHTLVIDNWKCLHGRSQIDTSSKRRLLHRTLLKIAA